MIQFIAVEIAIEKAPIPDELEVHVTAETSALNEKTSEPVPDSESEDDEIDRYERQLENTLLKLKIAKTLIDARKFSDQADESEDSESEF